MKPFLDNDRRHGTNPGYVAHGSDPACEPCKRAHATYRRNLRTRTYLARGRMLVDPTGTRRRIQALVALGYTMGAIDAAMGQRLSYTSKALLNETVFRSTAKKVARAYDELSMVVPSGASATRNRNYAAAKGWVPPLAWDEDTIDDPAAAPSRTTRVPSRNDVDEVVVERFIGGDHDQNLTKAERLVIVREWKATGRPLRALEAAGITRPDRILRRQEGAA